ncbi:helix-turn-helix domain-containing protein [Streptomyces halstedii]|uniref:helix-turn-helix domain-containing protein n=1 Tax=Streptomyces halstedii TaxID=1944 RepID=UPI00368B8C27
MIKKMGYHWHLRQIMAMQGMFQTSDLVPLLAERGVHLSREQVYRLVTQPPQRLSMDTLAALCDILSCGVQELIEVTTAEQSVRKTGTGPSSGTSALPQPRRASIRRPDFS